MSEDKAPVITVLKPRGGPLPPGTDYADELSPAVPPGLLGDDPISAAVGSPVFVERPGPSWVPWAVVPAQLGLTRRLTFERYYPHKRMAVDIFPAEENLEPEIRAQYLREADVKRRLCAANGVGYVGMFDGDEVPADLFRQVPTARTPDSTPVETRPLYAGGEDADVISAVVGTNGYIANATLPWALRFKNPDMPWSSEQVVFTRHYFTRNLLVDVFSRPEYQAGADAAKTREEIAFRRKLCHKHRVAYLVCYGDQAPSPEDLARALQRAKGEDGA